MTRKELLNSPEYWVTRVQVELYERALSFMRKTGKNRKELADYLGVSRSYVTQLLNGDFDHRLSKLVELSLAFGYIPNIDFIPTEQYMDNEREYQQVEYTNSLYQMSDYTIKKRITYKEVPSWIKTGNKKEVA